MIDLIVILVIYFFGLSIAFYAGYRIGYKKIIPKGPLSMENFDRLYEAAKDYENETPESFITEPSGPIYRPTAAELAKMSEDEAVKQAKEALKETFDSEQPPTI